MSALKHRDSPAGLSSGINSTMINTFRVLSHRRTRLETTIGGQLFTWMTRQKGTRRLNEIEEQRYLSSNSNSRFMMEQRCGNRYGTIHSPRKYRRYCSSDSLTLRSTNGSLIVDSIENLWAISRVLSRNLLIGKYSHFNTCLLHIAPVIHFLPRKGSLREEMSLSNVCHTRAAP